MLGHPPTALIIDLDQFSPDSARSWPRTVAALRDRLGPFTLAYLETLVRISDWRGSGARELATDIYAIDTTAKLG
jgi:CRISPR-associated endonuclease/helicase Cas3